MSCRRSDRKRVLRGRWHAIGVGAVAFALMVLAACEHPAPSAPAKLAVLTRPVIRLAAPRTGEPMLVPSAALVTRGGIPGVFVLQEATPFPPGAHDAAGTVLPEARFRMVKTGKTLGGRVEILSGLSGDEVLVLGGLSEVRDGSPVAVRR